MRGAYLLPGKDAGVMIFTREALNRDVSKAARLFASLTLSNGRTSEPDPLSSDVVTWIQTR